jgi:hypothetical protein
MVVCQKGSGVGPTGCWPADCLEARLAEEDPGSTAEIPGALDPDQGMVHEMNCYLSTLKKSMRINLLVFFKSLS